MPSKAQRRAYVIKDSIYIQGYLNNAADALYGRPVLFSATRNSLQITFKPADILAYGFIDSWVYLSKNVAGNQLFLRQVVDGDVSLYATKINGKLQFYLHTNDQLTELIKKDKFRSQLQVALNNCPAAIDRTKLVFFNQRSLPRIINYYNDCSGSFFPYTRFGVIIGSTTRTLNLRYRGLSPSFKSKMGVTIGAFIDIPNGDYSKISTRIEVLYKSHKYALHEENIFVERDYTVELSAINVPVLLRLRQYYSSVQSFYEFGFVFGLNIKKDIVLVETRYDPVGLIIEEFDLDIIDNKEFGLALGAGLEYQLDYKKTLGIEIRYQYSFGIEGRIEHTIADLQLLASFNF